MKDILCNKCGTELLVALYDKGLVYSFDGTILTKVDNSLADGILQFVCPTCNTFNNPNYEDPNVKEFIARVLQSAKLAARDNN